MAMLTTWTLSLRPSRSKSQDATKRKTRMQKETTISLVSSSEPNCSLPSRGARISSRTWRSSMRLKTRMTSTSKLKTLREKRMKLSDHVPRQSIISHQFVTLPANQFKDNLSANVRSHFCLISCYNLTRNSSNPLIISIFIRLNNLNAILIYV